MVCGSTTFGLVAEIQSPTGLYTVMLGCGAGGVLPPTGREDLQDTEGAGREEIEEVTAAV